MMKQATLCMILCLTLGFLMGCTGKDGAFDISKPYVMDLTPPDGPPEYRLGWSDGCESGMSMEEPAFYKSLQVHDFKLDPVLRKNGMYMQIWNDAYFYCTLYMLVVRTEKI